MSTTTTPSTIIVKRKNGRKSFDLLGTKIVISLDKGLGQRYFEHMTNKLDQILQVDTVSGSTESNGAVRGRAIQLALELKKRHIHENDIVLISSRCNGDQTIVVLATLFVGAIVAPIDSDMTYSDSLEIVGKLKPKICFCGVRAISQIERVVSKLNLTTDLIVFSSDYDGAVHFGKLFDHKEDNQFKPFEVSDPKRTVAFILPTQGTTGLPKLVCISHLSMYVHTIHFLDFVGYPEKVISFFPLSWIMQTILMCACFEHTIVRVLPGEFTERNACKLIHDLSIDHVMLSTDLALKFVGNIAIRDFNLSCVNSIMIGGIIITRHYMTHFRTALPKVKFLQAYSLTETGCIAACPVHNYNQSLCEKCTSVGMILPNCKIRVIDLVTGDILGPNKPGELMYSGDGLMLGYFKDPLKTISSMERIYFRTGDFAKYDEDGWVYILGRIDDMLPQNEGKMSPMNLENVIMSHPFVHDVVVIGNGTEVIACVIKANDANLTPDKLMKFIHERASEDMLRPTKIAFMDQFPKTKVGKVKRHKLRENFFKIQIEYKKSLASITL